MKRPLSWAGFAVLLGAAALGQEPSVAVQTQAAKPEPVALIVHKQNELKGLTLKELRALFKLEKRSWPAGAGGVSGKGVSLLLRASGTPEQDLVLDKVYEMNAGQLERFWVEGIYQGKFAAAPATKGTPAQAIKAVARDPAALSFVLLKDVTDDVKVLAIDGEAPGGDKYPLR